MGALRGPWRYPALMDDAKNYQAPERLENGDILIRRRADAPPPPLRSAMPYARCCARRPVTIPN